MQSILIFFACGLCSFIGTHIVMRLLARSNIIDIPNARSNHTAPVLRGGGIAIVLVILFGLVFVQHQMLALPISDIMPILIGVLLLAVVSFCDDMRGVSAKVRLCVQIIAVMFGLTTVTGDGMFSQIPFPAWVYIPLLGVAWVWFINLFNFMDGIDGITSSETLTITLSVAFLSIAQLLPPEYGFYPLVVAGAAFGFLCLNWHPAKIFMGDVGSVVLGYVVAWLLIGLAGKGYILIALLLPLYYLFDSAITLLKRLFAGEKIWEAHSKHYYQQAVRSGKSHGQVVLKIIRYNLLLFVYALAAIFMPQYGIVILAIAGLSTYGFLLNLRNS